MGKGFKFIFILLLFLLVGNVLAADAPLEQTAEDLEDKVDTLGSIVEGDEQDKIAKDYLKKEWDKLLGDGDFLARHPELSFLAFLYRGYKSISPYTDPVFGWLLGMVPAFSWLFFLVLIFWRFIVNSSFAAYEALRDYKLFSKRGTILIFVAFLAILFLLRIPQMISVWLANIIVTFISEAISHWWVQAIIAIAVIIIAFFLTTLQKKGRVILSAMREKKNKEEINESAEEGKRQAERMKKAVNSFEEASK